MDGRLVVTALVLVRRTLFFGEIMIFKNITFVCLIVFALAGSVSAWGPSEDVVIDSYVNVTGFGSGEIGIPRGVQIIYCHNFS